MIARLFQRLAARWDEFFFAPDSPANLAVCRAPFYGGMLALHWTEDFAGWGRVAEAFWMPLGTFERLGLRPLGGEVTAVMSFVWKSSLVLACVGLLTRPAQVLAFVLGFYLMGLRHSLGDLSHGDAAAVLILDVLTLGRVDVAPAVAVPRAGFVEADSGVEIPAVDVQPEVAVGVRAVDGAGDDQLSRAAGAVVLPADFVPRLLGPVATG